VTDFAKVDEPTAPVFRHRRGTLEDWSEHDEPLRFHDTAILRYTFMI
jgi:hypothetical protein